jgi:hypothetical protein
LLQRLKGIDWFWLNIGFSVLIIAFIFHGIIAMKRKYNFLQELEKPVLDPQYSDTSHIFAVVKTVSLCY